MPYVLVIESILVGVIALEPAFRLYVTVYVTGVHLAANVALLLNLVLLDTSVPL